jgi:hypothetical protein
VGATHSENDLVGIDFVTEVNVVNFVSVTLVHVSSQNQVKDCFRSENSELI